MSWMTILALILMFIGYIGAILQTIAQAKESTGAKKGIQLLTILILILIIIGCVGTLLLTIGQSMDSAKDKQEIIEITKNENKQLKEKLSELQ